MYFTIEPRPIQTPLTVKGEFALLPLYDRLGRSVHAKIDVADYDRCETFAWYLDQLGYAAANTAREGVGISCMLSKYIFYGASSLLDYSWYAPELTFANGNRLDCRRANLVPCDRSELNRRSNLKRYADRALPTGVRLKPGKRSRPYQALIRTGGREISLGCYETPELAAEAYRMALGTMTAARRVRR